MPRPKGPSTRVLSLQDRGTVGSPRRYQVRVLVDGEHASLGFASRAEAEAYREAFQRQHSKQASEVVDAVITAWIADRVSQGLSVGRADRNDNYYETYVRRICADALDMPIAALEGAVVVDGFKAACEGKAGASSKLYLACFKMFGKWCVEEKLLKVSPAEGLKVRGKVNRRKEQIETKRELFAFRDEAWVRARAGDRASLGVLLGLYLGLRSGEVLRIEARHLDMEQTLRVPGTKTAAAKRAVKVPVDDLWGLLEGATTEGRAVPLSDTTLRERVKMIARAVGLANAEKLCFHSLRGIAASLATEGGAPEHAIARSLGHASYATTAAHYATADSRAAAQDGQRLKVLKGGRG